MKPLTQEWIDKAEEDWITLNTMFRARKSPAHNSVVFHAQQCAEKYLKARMAEAGIAFPKTHALPALLASVLPVEPGWNALQTEMTGLNPYGVLYRYPGFSTDRDEAKDARKNCAIVRAAVRLSLGLPV